MPTTGTVTTPPPPPGPTTTGHSTAQPTPPRWLPRPCSPRTPTVSGGCARAGAQHGRRLQLVLTEGARGPGRGRPWLSIGKAAKALGMLSPRRPEPQRCTRLRLPAAATWPGHRCIAISACPERRTRPPPIAHRAGSRHHQRRGQVLSPRPEAVVGIDSTAVPLTDEQAAEKVRGSRSKPPSASRNPNPSITCRH